MHKFRTLPLDNHAKDLASIDFFAVPTATFRILYALLVLRHGRRRVVHFNVTEHPTPPWSAQQMLEVCPWDEVPRSISCAIATRSTTPGSVAACVASGSKRCSPPRARLGRIPMSNA
jgi:hypothetical protein